MIAIRGLNKFFNKGKQNQIHVINNVDLELPDTVSDMYGEISEHFNCAAEDYSLTINGLCPQCRGL